LKRSKELLSEDARAKLRELAKIIEPHNANNYRMRIRTTANALGMVQAITKDLFLTEEANASGILLILPFSPTHGPHACLPFSD